MRPVLKAASGESGGIYETDTQETLPPAAHHRHTLRRVSDPQLTGTSFTFLINRRGSYKFFTAIALVLCSVGHICLQQVLQVTLAGMCPNYREIYLLVVSTISQTLAVINVAMLLQGKHGTSASARKQQLIKTLYHL
jgi:hypothetical protein